MYRIFVTHTHTYPDAIAQRACDSLCNFYEFTVEGNGTYIGLEKEARESHVEGFLIFSVATNARQVEKVNSAIASLAEMSRSHGFKTIGYAGMHQDYPDFEKEIDRCISIGLKGVKIHPDIQYIDIDNRKLFPLYEILDAKNMPLYLHMGDNRPMYRYSEPVKLVNVLKAFPHLQVVAAHMGGYKAWGDAEILLPGYDNLMFDLASVLEYITPEHAERMIGKFGSDRIMFGSDYPVTSIDDEIKMFMRLNLTEKERDNILWNNAARFYGLE